MLCAKLSTRAAVDVCAPAEHGLVRRRSERLAKYNQLLRIEEELGAEATYAGDSWRHIGW